MSKVCISFVRCYVSLVLLCFAVLSGCTCPANIPSTIGLKTDLPGNRLVFESDEQGQFPKARSMMIYAEGADVRITDISIEGDTAFSLLTKFKPPFVIKQGKGNGIQVDIGFASGVAGANAILKVRCPDCVDGVDENDDFRIRLQSLGASVPKPVWDCGGKLAFGDVSIGKEKTLSCALKNDGNGDLVLERASYESRLGGSAVDFRMAPPEGGWPYTLKAGTSVSLSVTYAPTDASPLEDAGSFRIEVAKSLGETPPSLSVEGKTLVGARVMLLPLYPACTTDEDCFRIDKRLACRDDSFSKQKLCQVAPGKTPFVRFPLTSLGKTTRRKFLIRSIGEKPLKVETLAFGADSTQGHSFQIVTSGVSLPFTLDPKTEKEIEVLYTPKQRREESASIVVSTNDPVNPKAKLPVEVASRGCDIDVKPRKLEFKGPQSFQVTIVNRGNEACLLKKVSLKSGVSDPFSLLPAPPPNQLLVPNGGVSFLVKYAPKNTKNQSDVLVIESDDSDESVIEVPLSGGHSDPSGCSLRTNAALRFGFVGVGERKPLLINLTNKGSSNCLVSKVELSGTKPAGHLSFSLATKVSFPLLIGAGATVRLEIAYAPTTATSYEGEMRIASNDPQNPNLVVKLEGAAGFACLLAIPSSVDMGQTKFGCATSTYSIEVLHTGASGCPSSISINRISIASNANGEFRLMSSPTLPRTLTAGQTIRTEVSYKAKDLGADVAILLIENSTTTQSLLRVPLSGEGSSTSDRKDIFVQPRRQEIDVLFVLDDSGSTSNLQARMAQNAKDFLLPAIRFNLAYQVLVTTMDLLSRTHKPGCTRGNTRIVSPQTPNPVASLAGNFNVGTLGSAREQGLEAAYRALTAPATLGCNKGFLRRNASLGIIFMTNETDQSPRSVDFYKNFFLSLKGRQNKALVSASVIAGEPPNGCRSASASASAAPRYWSLSTELGGIQRSVCTSNWKQVMADLGKRIFSFRRSFGLSTTPDPKTIVVKSNGRLVQRDQKIGWFYDVKTNSVVFTDAVLPPSGANIVVEYKAICLP